MTTAHSPLAIGRRVASRLPVVAPAYRRMRARRGRVQEPDLATALAAAALRIPWGAVQRVEIDADGIWLVDHDGSAWAYSVDPPVGTGFSLETGVRRESREYELVRSLAGPGAVFLDVGANVGTFSVRLCRDVPGLGKVIALEPATHTCGLLRRNAARNRVHATIVQAAVGDAVGEIEITSGRGTGNHIAVAGEPAPAEVVPVTTVDALVEEHGLVRVDVVKCDVEGAELAALRGAAATLARFRPHVVIEIEQRWTTRYGYDAVEVFAFLADAGYERFERVGGGDVEARPDWEAADYVAAGGGNFHFPR